MKPPFAKHIFHIQAHHWQYARYNDKRVLLDVAMLDLSNLDQVNRESAICQFIKSQKIPSQEKVLVVLPRQQALIRNLRLPSIVEREIASMVELQAINNSPYSREQVEISWQVLNQEEGYSTVRVILMPISVIVYYLDIMKKLNIKVIDVLTNMAGIEGYLSSHHEISDGLYLEISAQQIHLGYIQEHRLIVSREFSYQDAQEFMSQWQKTLIGFQDSHGLPPANTLWVISNMPLPDWLESFIKEHYQYKLISTIQDLNVIKKKLSITELAQNLSWIVIAGIWSMDTKGQFSLMPKNISRQRQQLNQRQQVKLVVILVLMAVASVVLACSIAGIMKNSSLVKLEHQLRLTKKEAREINQLKEQVHNINQLINNRVVFHDLMQALSKVLPKRVVLMSVELHEDKMSIEGYVGLGQDVSGIQQAMVDDGYWSQVNLDYVNKRITQDGEVNYFKITATIDKVNTNVIK